MIEEVFLKDLETDNEQGYPYQATLSAWADS